MRIRNMEQADLERVSALEQESFSMPWSKEAFQDALKMKDSIYLVVEEASEIIAYCGVWVILDEGQINNVAVSAHYRNQGVGYKLLHYLLEEGEKKGIGQFTLEVRKSNSPAIHLYEKLGFQSLGIRPDFYEHPVEDAVIMTVITSRKD